MGRRYSELPNEFFEACYWMQSRGISMRVAAELAGMHTSTFHRMLEQIRKQFMSDCELKELIEYKLDRECSRIEGRYHEKKTY